MGSGYAAVGGFNAAIPFGERITAGIGSALAAPFIDKPIGDIYDEMRKAQAATAEANPNSRLAGTIGGIAATLPAGIVTKGSQAAAAAGGIKGAVNALPQITTKVGNWAIGGKAAQGATTAAKIGSGLLRSARSAAVAAPVGALYGAGEAAEGQQLEGAAGGAGLAAAVGGALPVAGAALGAAANKVLNKTVVPGADEVKALASQAYKRATETGGLIKANTIDSFIDDVANMKRQTAQGQALGGDDAFTQLANKLEFIRGQPMTLDAAQEVDEILGDQIDNFYEMGKLKKEGYKIQEIQNKFRDMIENAGDDAIEGTQEGFQALKEGRKLWSTSRKLADIERIFDRADGVVGSSATAIQNGFRTLSNNPNRMRGYSAAERNAIKAAARGGPVQDVFRTFGSRLFSIAAPFSGAGIGGTAAVTAANVASRGIAEKLAATKGVEVSKRIAESAGFKTTQPRFTPEQMKQIMQMPVSEAKKLLEGLK